MDQHPTTPALTTLDPNFKATFIDKALPRHMSKSDYKQQ